MSRPLCELKPVTITDIHHAIGKNVAGLIEDGATLQLGIGAIPDAVLLELGGHQNLGIHTEMLSDKPAVETVRTWRFKVSPGGKPTSSLLR